MARVYDIPKCVCGKNKQMYRLTRGKFRFRLWSTIIIFGGGLAYMPTMSLVVILGAIIGISGAVKAIYYLSRGHGLKCALRAGAQVLIVSRPGVVTY